MKTVCIENRNGAKKNQAVKAAQKEAKKYYKDPLFSKEYGPKARINKFVSIQNIEYKSFFLEKDNEFEASTPSLTKEQLITLCSENALKGRSGNNFPTDKKLTSLKGSCRVLIINGVECDPGLLQDAWLYRNKMKEIERGASILVKALNLNRVVLATKEPLKDNSKLEQVKVLNRFPMGYEKTLIKAVLGMDLSIDSIPTDKGILVLNLQTVIAIGQIVRDRSKACEKYIIVSDLTNGKAFVTKVKLGTDISEVVNFFFPKDSLQGKKIYTGSGALSAHLLEENEKVSDTTGLISLALAPDYECAGKCKGCRACVKNCPAGVNVMGLVSYVEKNGMTNPENTRMFNPQTCIGCGACTYGCMAGKDLRDIVKWAKENTK